MDSPNSLDLEITKLEQKAQGANLPLDLLEKVNVKIALLKISSRAAGGNFTGFDSVVNYVNWICSLPFNMETQDVLDLAKIKQTLDKNHYGLDSVKNTILEYMSSLILNMQNHTSSGIKAPVLCFVGLAGTGKTTLASSIAESLGRRFTRIPFGGMGDAFSLRGQSRAFADAEPGLLIKRLAETKSKNCVVLLDELDRISEEARADIMGVLIEMLDLNQNKAFSDHYIDYPFDLSHILFIATANNTTNISTAVLDRLEIIQMPSYSDEEKRAIAKDYLFPKAKQNAGLDSINLTIEDSLWPTIIRPLGFDSGIRSLDRSLQTMARRVAKMVVERKIAGNANFAITAENVKEFLPL